MPVSSLYLPTLARACRPAQTLAGCDQAPSVSLDKDIHYHVAFVTCITWKGEHIVGKKELLLDAQKRLKPV